MTDFLIIVENLKKFNKLDVDQGKIPQDVHKICSCIRNTFCLSYSIRKRNNIYLYFLNNQLIIKFDGNKLKYLGPDERSQSLLLNKALSLSNERISKDQYDWIESTPGIFIKKLSSNQTLKHYIDSLTLYGVIIFFQNFDFIPNFLDKTMNVMNKLEESLFIFTSVAHDIKKINVPQLLSTYKNAIPYKLPILKSIEDKILYINFQIDRFKDNKVHSK